MAEFEKLTIMPKTELLMEFALTLASQKERVTPAPEESIVLPDSTSYEPGTQPEKYKA